MACTLYKSKAVVRQASNKRMSLCSESVVAQADTCTLRVVASLLFFLQIVYNAGGQSVQEMAQVSNFPNNF